MTTTAPSCSAAIESGSQLRSMGREELVRLGEDSLREHLFETAVTAHQRYMPLDASALQQLLEDPSLVRYPVRLAYELGTMASHQFAQPEPDMEGEGYVLYLHPSLQGQEEDVVRAVLYFLPVMNYRELISDEHCLVYGATVLGLTLSQYYEQLCALATSIGAQPA